ncbi:MAG: class E sortase, partial [Candidatus Aquicultor sp.]
GRMARDRISRILRIAGLVLIAVGVLILLKINYTDVETGYNQKRMHDAWVKAENRTHGSDFQEDLPVVSAPSSSTASTKRETASSTETTSSIAQGQKAVKRVAVAHLKPFARIVIPRIKLDAIVVEGVDGQALALGPGHMEETAYPGEVGNMVISGHRVTHSHPFFYLDELKQGDPIEIHTESRKYTYYVVKQKIVAPTDVSVIAPTKDKTLTLTTCNPRYSAKTRLIIIAKMMNEDDLLN